MNITHGSAIGCFCFILICQQSFFSHAPLYLWYSSQSQTGQDIRALLSYSIQNILYCVPQGTLEPLEWTSACCSMEASCLGCLGLLALPYMDLCSRSERVACKWIKAVASTTWKPNLTKAEKTNWDAARVVPAGSPRRAEMRAAFSSPPGQDTRPSASQPGAKGARGSIEGVKDAFH